MRKLWKWLRQLWESFRYGRESDDYDDYEDYEDDEEMEECEEDTAEKQHRIPPRKLQRLGELIKKVFQRNSRNKSPPKKKGAILWTIHNFN